MTYVITQTCCNDASCVTVCPVDCIHPTPAERGFMSTEMLHIDPAICIDCGACVDACPVDAIRLDVELEEAELRFRELNAAYYRHGVPSSEPEAVAPPRPVRRAGYEGLRVAIVGSGPAAHYAAAEILALPGAEVDMYERLLTPYGLVRAGVAPDHPGTKSVADQFRRTAGRDGFHLHLGVEVGKHLSHADLVAHHSAVVYAVGASGDRKLGIDGEDLPGVHAASEFVAWYNGHPDHAKRRFDLSGPRAVVVGNGNVALDIARILASDPEVLARTDIADHALEALRHSKVREVVVLGRRGPAQAAYTTPELHALMHLPGVDLVIDPQEAAIDATTQHQFDAGAAMASSRMKAALAAEVAAGVAAGIAAGVAGGASGTSARRIVLRFLLAPDAVVGDDRARALRVVRNRLELGADGTLEAKPTGECETIDAGLILRSIGYRGAEIEGLPFERTRGVIPNDGGRVVDPHTRAPVAGTYATGWIKRGPSGVIGTNKQCARETVDALLDDFDAGRLRAAPTGRVALERWIAERSPDAVDREGWARIDAAEREAGAALDRPRVKLVETDAQRAKARG